MIADDGTTPILMDLGSLAPSPVHITSRAQALAVQDAAAEHSTMPYRAPELFDVKTGGRVDAAVDVWSLGCTLYACLVGRSPFEARSEETGGSPEPVRAGRGLAVSGREEGRGREEWGQAGGGPGTGGGKWCERSAGGACHE